MPAATETLRLSLAGSIARRARWSQRSAVSRRSPFSSAPRTRTERGATRAASSSAGAVGRQPDAAEARLGQLVEGAGEVRGLDDRHPIERTRGRLRARTAELGRAVPRQDDPGDAHGCGAAQDGAEIARVVHLVEGQEQARLGKIADDVGQGQGRQRADLECQALVRGIGRKAACQTTGVDRLEGEPRPPAVGLDRRECLRGGEKAKAGALGIGEGGGHRVAAPQPDAAVAAPQAAACSGRLPLWRNGFAGTSTGAAGG